MTYAELAKKCDDLKIENETLRVIMDKMLEQGHRLQAENSALKRVIAKCYGCPECRAIKNEEQ